MAYEKIDVNSLKNALNSCSSSINCNITLNLINSLSNDNIWYGNAKNNLKGSLNKLSNLYNSLNSDLGKYKSIALEIEKYKQCQSMISSLEKQKNEMSPKLYYDTTEKDWHINPETGKWEEYDKPVRKKDYGVEKRINEIDGQIGYNRNEMTNIENSIASKI